jgi:hypothetical protein
MRKNGYLTVELTLLIPVILFILILLFEKIGDEFLNTYYELILFDLEEVEFKINESIKKVIISRWF